MIYILYYTKHYPNQTSFINHIKNQATQVERINTTSRLITYYDTAHDTLGKKNIELGTVRVSSSQSSVGFFKTKNLKFYFSSAFIVNNKFKRLIKKQDDSIKIPATLITHSLSFTYTTLWQPTLGFFEFYYCHQISKMCFLKFPYSEYSDNVATVDLIYLTLNLFLITYEMHIINMHGSEAMLYRHLLYK